MLRGRYAKVDQRAPHPSAQSDLRVMVHTSDRVFDGRMDGHSIDQPWLTISD
jgi:hypothetical protein